MIAAARPILAVLEREVIKLLRQRWRVVIDGSTDALAAGDRCRFRGDAGRSGSGNYPTFLVPGVRG